LGRIQRDPNSHYRAKLLHQLSLEPDKDTSDKLDELEYLGWSAETYALKDITDAVISLRHVVLSFATSFSKNAKAIEEPEPSYRPGQDNNAATASKGSKPNRSAKKPNPYAGAKVITLAEMDAEFFAEHKTEYGV
jgi:hypothetical protein